MTEQKETKALDPELDIEADEEGFEESFEDVYDFVDKDLFYKTGQILKDAKKG